MVGQGFTFGTGDEFFGGMDETDGESLYSVDRKELEADVELDCGEFLVDLRSPSDDCFVYPHKHRTGVDGLVGRLRFRGTQGKFVVFAAFNDKMDKIQDIVIHGE